MKLPMGVQSRPTFLPGTAVSCIEVAGAPEAVG